MTKLQYFNTTETGVEYKIMKIDRWQYLDVCPCCGSKINTCLLSSPPQYRCEDCYRNNPEYRKAWDGS